MTSRHRNGPAIAGRQEGAVLLVSLLILLLITLASFAVMETSTLEAKMATASEQKAITFQMAEAAVTEATDSLDLLGDAYGAWLADDANPNWPTANHAITGYDGGTRNVSAQASSETRFKGTASTIGYSIRKGSAGLETFYYEAEAVSTISNGNISNIHVQGVFAEAPRTN